MQPIWKDYIVTAGSSGPYDFRIVRVDDNSNEDIVFEGRAYARPGETDVKIRMNDVVADVLARRAEIVKAVVDDMPGDLEYTIPFQFRLDVKSGGSWATKVTETFMEDWSYDNAHNPASDPAADPITGRLDPRQYLIHTKPTTGAVSVKFTKPNGQTATVSVPQKTGYANAFELDVISLGGSDILYAIASRYPTYDKVQIGTVKYTIVPACNRYVLYYVNAFGGWDSFLIEGPTDIADAQARTVHAKEYDNADLSAAGRKVTVNELTRGYTFRTGWLTDDESSRMHHLLNSADVYVHDLVDGTIFPVILTGTETRHKTFRTNGRQFVDYTITAQLAQERIRR